MPLVAELIVGLAIGYVSYQLQTLDSKVDKAIIEIERLKIYLPKRSTDNRDE